MRRVCFLLSLIFLTSTAAAQTGVPFDRFFEDKTMRVDYYHTGTKTEEIYSLDEVWEEPIWAGSKVNLIDTLNLGKYLLKVFDLKTNQLIYSRGFCSLFGEWQTTEEAAKGVYRTFHESVRFPYPKRDVQVIIAARDRENIFHDAFSTVIDPKSRFIKRERRFTDLKVKAIMKNGPPSKKVDLLIIGDGYTPKEMKKFHKDVSHFMDVLFSTAPFKENKDRFNVWIIEVPSQESGSDEPRKGLFRNTILDCSFNTFDLPRYLMTYDNKTLRNIAANAPYDQLYILVNTHRYGGGGIFNLYAVCVSDNKWSDYIFVHEFGHSFAGLADEYYSSKVTYVEFYPPGVEPWEPNITALLDTTNIKWGHLIKPGTPIPTPPDTAKYANTVGCFEGAGYMAKGMYRPYLDCRMFSKSSVDFCPVCQEAIQRVIDFYSR